MPDINMTTATTKPLTAKRRAKLERRCKHFREMVNQHFLVEDDAVVGRVLEHLPSPDAVRADLASLLKAVGYHRCGAPMPKNMDHVHARWLFHALLSGRLSVVYSNALKDADTVFDGYQEMARDLGLAEWVD